MTQVYNYSYIDLTPIFSDLDGRLPAKDTIDSLHINDSGYLLWREYIMDLMVGK